MTYDYSIDIFTHLDHDPSLDNLDEEAAYAKASDAFEKNMDDIIESMYTRSLNIK